MYSRTYCKLTRPLILLWLAFVAQLGASSSRNYHNTDTLSSLAISDFKWNPVARDARDREDVAHQLDEWVEIPSDGE
jgi:hypothetical protein